MHRRSFLSLFSALPFVQLVTPREGAASLVASPVMSDVYVSDYGEMQISGYSGYDAVGRREDVSDHIYDISEIAEDDSTEDVG